MKELLTLGLTVILGAIVLYMGIFLATHLEKSFFGVFHPQENPSLQKAMRIWAIILIILGIFTIISAFVGIVLFQVIMLLLDAFFVLILSFFMPTYLRL
ncbi:hypothetical protein [Ligilactobacillus apodemi]|uniref:Integral membrane protein n=1 Tax=Ligilactobacillus apodemi DSM 16634 = JCM 16172 TaxID=1423724 RepID=A0A0R1TZX6_9LACO|nr:hypothetical protein [Ligilactobacillus apodemi]KRL84181.1 hypothetical protein FC32_GL001463 [Ligilactobacillus apodemi DSM 16634 = JCM 16172]MCR1901224.1 hypothetical protein [Ligilactobacillus apodemi]